jgi:hypothetical protein
MFAVLPGVLSAPYKLDPIALFTWIVLPLSSSIASNVAAPPGVVGAFFVKVSTLLEAFSVPSMK